MGVALRIAIVCLAAGAGAVLTWRWSGSGLERRLAEAQQQMEALQDELEARLEVKEAMIERLNRSSRRAHISVTAQREDPGGGIAETDIEFIELDDEGRELGRQAFTLAGDVIFVDAWSVKFNQADVAEGHPLRGRSLILFRRIYSERTAPMQGYPIDTPGAIPPGYATGEAAAFEKRIWELFWELATDPELAAEMGVRVAQGEAVYKPLRPGSVYELTVDAAGGMSLMPMPEGEK